jgi:hypothetical protein
MDHFTDIVTWWQATSTGLDSEQDFFIETDMIAWFGVWIGNEMTTNGRYPCMHTYHGVVFLSIHELPGEAVKGVWDLATL